MTESGMEKERDDVKSMLPLLPLSMRLSHLCWPSSAAVEALEAVARGSEHSRVVSSEVMARFISHLRDSRSLSSDDSFDSSAPLGYSLFFDELFPRDNTEDWFRNVVTSLANLLTRLPSLLEDHWRDADNFVPEQSGLVRTSLRVLDQQEAGVVLLSQEHCSGHMEDHAGEAVLVDFANKFLEENRKELNIVRRLSCVTCQEERGAQACVWLVAVLIELDKSWAEIIKGCTITHSRKP